MSSAYLSLCVKLRQEVGVAGTGPTTVTGQTGMFKKIVDWVADADVDIQTKYLDWGFLLGEHSVSTISGVKDYAKPSDFCLWDYESFYIDRTEDTYKNLIQMDYVEWRRSHRNGTKTNSQPSWFIIKPDKDIILESPPDGVYALTADYYKTPTRMTANTSTSLIPTKFDRLIIARAKIYYAEHENATEVMQGALTEYADLMGRLESLYLPGQEARTRAGNNDMITVIE